MKKLALIALAWFSGVLASFGADAPIKPGDVVYQVTMPAAGARLPSALSWTTDGPNAAPALKATVAPDRAEAANVMRIPVDLRPWRGMQGMIVAEVKADGVTAPPHAWLGVKCMLHFKSATGERWVSPNEVHGTFDWRMVSCRVEFDNDVTDGEWVLGLQSSSGTAWLSNVRLVAARVPPARPAPRANPPPAYRGHDQPRLRGVMSPTQFREEDFAELARWKVNLVRWQLVRNWGKAGTDRDLAEYDTWINGKLDELARVLAAAQRHGIRIVIDLHSPPGGREADSTLTMLLDRRYQEHFVALWERIARRFRGHPALWAYDLINEPVQNTPSPAGLEDWLGVQVQAARAIRAIDPTTAIAIEVEQWDSPDAFRWLTPVDVPNVIYQVHMYQPGEYTHQGVHNNWGEHGKDHLLAYPGTFKGAPFDQEWLRRRLEPVREFQRAYNVHVYVGEFSAIRWAPGADRYLADLIGLFEEYGWDWSYHAFREWPGWSVEHAEAPADPNHHVKATQPTARAQVLWRWFGRSR